MSPDPEINPSVYKTLGSPLLTQPWATIMAKPMSVPYADSPRRQGNTDTSKSTRPRRTRHTTSTLSPSSTVLSLLATVVASSTSACASPTPLSFLCPSLEARPPTPKPTPAAVVPRNLQKRFRRRPGNSSQVRRIPDKFEYDNETGHWKRVESWTLYGSTVCSTCPQASGSMSVDDSIQPPTSTSTSNGLDTSPTSTDEYDILDSLPPGWLPSTKYSESSRVTLILVGSLVLAAAICFLTISCLFWRKTRHRKRRKDLEMKARRRRNLQNRDDEEANTELIVKRESKESKVKHKIWARATARWKAHAHYTARQRKGKRPTVSRVVDPRSSAVSLASTQRPAQPSSATTVAPSPPISRRSSLESMYMEDPNTRQTEPTDTPAPQSESTSHSGQHPPRQSFSSDSVSISIPAPPAYRQRPNSNQVKAFTPQEPLEANEASPPAHLHRSSLASYSSSDPHPDSSAHQNHTAHVATDDKTILARLANLASAAPADGPSNRETSSEFEVSVPEWQDEELEDFGETENRLTSNQPPGTSSSAPLFPPLPSKGKMAEASYYEYAYEVETPPLEQAVAPPFVTHDQPSQASYPPLDDADYAPSAPPLPDDLEPDSQSVPSAPPLPESPAESDAENQACVIEVIPAVSPEHEMDIVRSSSPIPPVYGPVASDGTPPGYRH